MNHRFSALDGLRGVCAVAVLLFHNFAYSNPRPFAHGYLSVDVFFVLSGFVLTFAFGDKLMANMTLQEFMKARVRRLGPVLLLGSLLGAVGVIIQGTVPANVVVVVASAALLNALLIPLMNGGLGAFPMNVPSWSLFAELWVNVGFGLLASRIRRSALIAIIGAGWVFVIVYSFGIGSADFGATQATVLYSIPRAIPSFACGVLIFDLWKTGALAKLPSINPLLLFGVWTCVSIIPLNEFGALYDLVQIIITAPILVALLARYEGSTPAWTVWAGRISYPLYATHFAIIYTGQVLLLKNGHMPVWADIILPIVSIAIADAISRWYEPIFAKLWIAKSASSPIKTASA
jgi:peptidoglycan/LPS O-acetylase OafA/YrhL